MGELKLKPHAGAPPRWGTARDPANDTDGQILRRVARLMGFELFDWQAHVSDIALEKVMAFIGIAQFARK
jgi:hypothetical protein